jgi:hypothetical protein
MKNGTITITRFQQNTPFKKQVSVFVEQPKVSYQSKQEPYSKTNRPLHELAADPVHLF